MTEEIQDEVETERTIERKTEDITYAPVIIKRNDQHSRHPDDILAFTIADAVEQHNRPKLSLLISSMAAGLILGFAGMCVALMTLIFPIEEGILVNRLACAFIYPLGFIVCVMSRTQLFTEQTATALYSVLDLKSTVKSLITLWAIVLIGNLLGTFISSYLLYAAEPVINAGIGYTKILGHLLAYSFSEVFFSAILAGWLMAQGGWLIVATPPATTQMISIYIVTFIIGFGGLHHSIAGSAELFSGLLHTPQPDYLQALSFLTSAVLGNLVGGTIFVAALNYAHIKKTQST